MLTTGAILLSQLPRHGWQKLGELRVQHVLAALIMAASTLTLTQAASAEWDAITVVNDPQFPATFWARPEWLYPVVILSVAIFFSNFVLHLTRRAGFASVVMLMALGLRAGLLSLAGI